MNVLGLDPGSHKCGYAVVGDGRRDGGLIEMGLLRLTSKARLAMRLAELIKDIDEIIRDCAIDGVCLENVFVHPTHPQSSLVLAQARGAILGYIASREVFAVRGLEIIEPAPAAVKKFMTGNGQATKEQMQLAVQRECGMKKPPEPHDVADAIALAKYGRHHILLNHAVTA